MIRPFIYNPPCEDPDIIYQDEHILAVNKPAGLLSVPGKHSDHKDSLEIRVREKFPDALLVHRLDLATSGLILFARTPHAQRHLGLQFEKRYIRKTYKAEVWGTVHGNTGYINLPLRCDWPNRPKQMVCFTHGKTSQTHWEVEHRLEGSTRLLLYPITGRSHQLRVHLMAIGHPILGDRFYAHERAFKSSNRLRLHAETLELRHPEGGKEMVLKVPCPF